MTTTDEVVEAARTLAWFGERVAARPADDDALFEWVRYTLGITLSSEACCPAHASPAAAFADAYFARSSMSVWKASRGFGGKSFMLAALALAEAVTLGAEVVILGGSAEQSENVVRYMERWSSRTQLQGVLGDVSRSSVGGITKTRVRTTTGGRVDALAASMKSVRGKHPARLLIDEADELDLRVFDASLGQTMTRVGVRAGTVVSSTHHHARGTMTEVLDRARAGGWAVSEWCYRCNERTRENPDGWLTTAEIERKRRDVPPSMWRVEYDLQQPVPPGGRMLNRAWFPIVDDEPAHFDVVGRSWDEGATAGGGDPTVGAKVGLFAGVWYVCDVVRGQWSPKGVDAVIDQTAADDGVRVPILLQQEPGSSGKARVDGHRTRLAGYDVRAKPPTGDKGVRARPLSSAAEAGNVRLVKGTWNRPFLDEAEAFTGTGDEQDDQVDAVSWAMLMLAHPEEGKRRPYADLPLESLIRGAAVPGLKRR